MLVSTELKMVFGSKLSENCKALFENYLWCSTVDCCRGLPFGPLQQTLHHHQSGNPNRCPSFAARRVGQARCQWRNQGCHQVHKL